MAVICMMTMFLNPSAVQALDGDENCTNSWPTTGEVQTTNWPGSNEYVVTFEFVLTQEQLDELQCAGDFLELDFRIRNFDVPAEWEDYSIAHTNLPGALHDVAFEDNAYEANPAVTRIYTDLLQAGKAYYVTIRWQANALPGRNPYVFFVWTPSHWFDPSDPYEVVSCARAFGNEAWCIFPYENLAVYLGERSIFHGFSNGYLPLDGFRWYEWYPTATTGTYGVSAPPPPMNTLTLTQNIAVSPTGTIRAYQPFSFNYIVQNTSGTPASIDRLVVAVRGPAGDSLDVPCANGTGVTLAANQTFTCNANLPTGFGSSGQYHYWPDWLGYDGNWHMGEIGPGKNLNLAAPYQMSAVQPVSVGPSDTVTMYTPINWSFRMRNTSGATASIQRVVLAVRGPSGNALDINCDGGTGITLQPDQEWTCDANLPQGFGQMGSYTFWADWLDYNGQWHQGQLGANRTMTIVQAPTLLAVQPVSIGPSDYRPKLTQLWWSFRVRNTSGAYASIQRLVVAVRGPAGDALDVQCLNGAGVTLAPSQE